MEHHHYISERIQTSTFSEGTTFILVKTAFVVEFQERGQNFDCTLLGTCSVVLRFILSKEILRVNSRCQEKIVISDLFSL